MRLLGATLRERQAEGVYGAMAATLRMPDFGYSTAVEQDHRNWAMIYAAFIMALKRTRAFPYQSFALAAGLGSGAENGDCWPLGETGTW